MSDASFSIDLEVENARSPADAASALERLADAQFELMSATGSAAGAVRSAQAELAALKASAEGAAATLTTASAAVAEMKDNLAIAGQARVSADELSSMRDQLSALEAEESTAASAAKAAADALTAQGDAVAKLKGDLASAAQAERLFAAETRAGAAELKNLAKAAQKVGKDGKPSINELKGSVDDLAGPFGGLFKQALKSKEAFEEVSEKFGSGMAAGLLAVGAVATAVIVLVAVLAVATAAAIGLGVAIFKIAKAGVILADKEKRLEKIGKKLQDNYDKLFSGLKIEKLLDQFDILAELFDENTASGKALKFLFETLFQPLIDMAAKALPYVERGLLQLEIWAIKAYIAFQKFRKTEGFDTLVTVLKVVGVAVGLVAIGFVAIAAAIAASVAAMVAFIGGAVALVGILVGGVVAAVGAVIAAFVYVWDYLSSLDFGEIASNLVNSLVTGITNGIGAVVSAITSLGQSAISALESVLQIGSPSKVMKRIGKFTAKGLELGIDAGAPAAQGALESMMAPGDAASAAGGNTTNGGRVNITGNTFVFGEGTASDHADQFLAKVAAWLEGDAVIAGAANA